MTRDNEVVAPTSTVSEYDYIFGFGSIINSNTHASWLNTTDTPSALQGAHARIRPSFGYRRGWIFRSNTGFTALGISPSPGGGAASINGVLFKVPHFMMPGFDRREVGYDRVALSLEHLDILPPSSYGGNPPRGNDFDDVSQNERRIWVYIPQSGYCAEADENHPLLQSYVDTVMQGCLEWGGEDMAKEFVATTSGWSLYFLNDTPSSRRPWLFRKEYETIDRILSQSPDTHFADRRHPEEFASAFLIKMMRGTWSIPQRNNVFTGRDSELGKIHALLTERRTDTVAKLSVTGMGGVGKTQVCIEYVYRNFPSYYGLVIWLNAEAAETLAAGYRQLLADTTGVDVKDKDTDEVVGEVKARLFRSKVPWLLVFDNLEDRSLLEKFVPHGGAFGHVLVTTRLVELGDEILMLECFDPSESVELLCRSAGSHNIGGEENARAANELAGRLGNLPLALGMAAAYMQRCDVVCSEYLTRYVASERNGSLLGHQAGKLVDYPLGVASSLSLSLNAIKTENPAASDILRLLCWLGPDQITKPLLRSLLCAKNAAELVAEVDSKSPRCAVNARRLSSLVGGLAVLSLAFLLPKKSFANNRLRRMPYGVGALAALSLSATAVLSNSARSGQTSSAPLTPTSPTRRISACEFEQTDLIWKILKSFSLLTVKDGKGSMHRLLAQALRASQSDEESRLNLEICIGALQQLWSFKPERVETWQESSNVIEHVKSVVVHASGQNTRLRLETSTLSKEAGVFSAMALNRFKEAQFSLELSLKLLDGADHISKTYAQARAEALHELGRVFRYQGRFEKSEEALQMALEIRTRLASGDFIARQRVADTLHELGVLEVKKHNLESAEHFLKDSLDLRRSLEGDSAFSEVEADCAATLHQLAAVQVARKPPSLKRAEALLQEALGLSMQIGQRAATLKQLARVSIRQGLLDRAETYLAQALELYNELYGDSRLHINVAAVKFQQGALAYQREQLEEAFLHFSECLRVRRHVYAYIRPIQGHSSSGEEGNPAHLDVSSVLHELGLVAFAQQRMGQSYEMLKSEKEILERLQETTTQSQQILQARLRNLTWLRKCAKEVGDDEAARNVTAERQTLKRAMKQQTRDVTASNQSDALPLQREAVRCRLVARQFALADPRIGDSNRQQLRKSLGSLDREIKRSPPSSMQQAAVRFHDTISRHLSDLTARPRILEACDEMRDVLREQGLEVSDVVMQK